MRIYTSTIMRYLQYYYANKNNIIGLNAICEAFHHAKIYDMILFGEPCRREIFKKMNKNYQWCLRESRDNKERISLSIAEKIKYLPYIFNVIIKIDKKASEEGLDVGLAFMKWERGVLAFEKIG